MGPIGLPELLTLAFGALVVAAVLFALIRIPRFLTANAGTPIGTRDYQFVIGGAIAVLVGWMLYGRSPEATVIAFALMAIGGAIALVGILRLASAKR